MMTEQFDVDITKTAKKAFSKIGIGLVIFTVVSNVVGIVLVELLKMVAPLAWISKYSSLISFAISLVSMYFIALPMLAPLWGKMTVSKPSKNKLPLFLGFRFFAISVSLAYIGKIISILIQSVLASTIGTTFTNDTIDVVSQMRWYEAIIPVAVIFPLFEELLFRKLIIDRTRMYGEKLSILFSALMFAFFHCSIDQFFYTFAVGLLYGYIYVNTGKLSVCWILHGLFNIFGSVIPLVILEYVDYEAVINTAAIEDPELLAAAVEELLPSFVIIAAHGLVNLALTVIGGIFAEKTIRGTHFPPAEIRLPNDSEGSVAFVNVGTILFVGLCVVMVLLSAVSL